MRGILGADIFVNLLLVFIITTGLLLMNTNKVSKIRINKKYEQNLPEIQLPKGKSKGLSSDKSEKSVTLSARKTGEDIQYFVDDKPVHFKDLPMKINAGQVSLVKIRFDEHISYGHYVKILDLCRQAGISDIINVYTTKHKE
jgi:biopolymer transport protein ExbD